MNRKHKSLIIVFLGIQVALAQDQYLWIRLSENRVITNSRFYSLEVETLRVAWGNGVIPVPLSDVVQLRVMSNSSMLGGVAVGVGAGLALGCAVGYSLQAMDRPGPSPATTMVSLGFIGGIVGGTMAALEKPGDLVDLSGKSVQEKGEIIRGLLSFGRPEKP